MKQYINSEKVRRIVYSLGGRTFTVIFHKENGETRKLNGRRGVTKHLRGGHSTVAEQPHLISCFDLKKRAYRCFNHNRVLELRANREVVTA